MQRLLLLFGPGYCGSAIAAAAARAGFHVTLVSRRPAGALVCEAMQSVAFDAAEPLLAAATHLLSTVPPGPDGDPVLLHYAGAIRAAPAVQWIGYLSATSVYGDRGGDLVGEEAEPRPTSERGTKRLAAECAWQACAAGRPLDLFRLAGIYGPGRSAFDQLRAGTARRIIAPRHAFSRIHRDDIVAAVLAAMHRPPERTRVLNLADDEPAESATVLEEAARLLGLPPPPAIPLAEALPAMSPMARSFWAEQRRISSRKTQEMLGITWRFPTYREGLAAMLREELGERRGEER